MKFFTLAVVLATTLPAALGSLTINSPSDVTTCEPTQLTWSGGVAPYYLNVLPAGQPSATPLESLGVVNGTSYTWIVNLQGSESITLGLKDSTGALAYSSIITIQSGSSTSCLNTSIQPSSSASSGASPTDTSSGSSTTGSSGSSTATSSSSSPSSTSTKSNGADRLSVSSAFGIASIMGLVGAVLF